jgi:hypothetical protein
VNASKRVIPEATPGMLCPAFGNYQEFVFLVAHLDRGDFGVGCIGVAHV